MSKCQGSDSKVEKKKRMNGYHICSMGLELCEAPVIIMEMKLGDSLPLCLWTWTQSSSLWEGYFQFVCFFWSFWSQFCWSISAAPLSSRMSKFVAAARNVIRLWGWRAGLISSVRQISCSKRRLQQQSYCWNFDHSNFHSLEILESGVLMWLVLVY